MHEGAPGCQDGCNRGVLLGSSLCLKGGSVHGGCWLGLRPDLRALNCSCSCSMLGPWSAPGRRAPRTVSVWPRPREPLHGGHDGRTAVMSGWAEMLGAAVKMAAVKRMIERPGMPQTEWMPSTVWGLVDNRGRAANSMSEPMHDVSRIPRAMLGHSPSAGDVAQQARRDAGRKLPARGGSE
jgi:hypothetical protein